MAKGKDIVISLILDGKQFDATIQNSDQLVKKLKQSSTEITDVAVKWATVTTGFNQAIELSQKVFNQFKDSVTAAADLKILRDNFRGTADDIDLFRKATANTVSEANLIKLSNQAYDLGINLKDQALLFSLADDAGDKYGVGVEEGFAKLVTATEGGVKGLKDVGIQKEKYEEIVNDLAKAEGDTIENLDSETQKRIKLEAIIKASGITMDDVTSKTQDQADKLASLGIRIDEAKLKMGEWIADGLEPVYDMLGDTTDGVFGLNDGVLAVTASLPALISMLGSLKMAGANLGWLGKMAGFSAIAGGLIYPFVDAAGNKGKEENTMAGGIINSLLGTGPGVSGDKYERRSLNSGFKSDGKSVEQLKSQITELNRELKTWNEGSLEANTIIQERNNLLIKWNELNSTNKTGSVGGNKNNKNKKGKEAKEFDPFAFDKGDLAEEREAMYESDAEKEKMYLNEIERINELTIAKDEFFNTEMEREYTESYEKEALRLKFNDLENNLLLEEMNRADLMRQMQLAETQQEFKALQDKKKITDEKIKIIKAEKEARERAAFSMIESGMAQYNAEETLGKQMNRLVNESIKRIISEAVATQIAKVIAMVPWPFNLVVAPAAGLALQALMEQLIPSFATGVTNFRGGIALVGERGPELVTLPSGSDVIPNRETRNVLFGSDSNMDGFRLIASEIRNQTERLESVERIINLDANRFDEAYNRFQDQKLKIG